MKTLAPLLGFLALSAVSAVAQQAQPTNSHPALVHSQPVAKEETKKPVLMAPKSTNAILGHPVTYGGYVSDFIKAENKRALFDLKSPLDEEKDMRNLWFYTRSPQVRGVVLFSVKF
jgi:hypothetical protein